MDAPDRLKELLKQNIVTGIDFVYVHQDQKKLDVYFFIHDDGPQAEDIVGIVAIDQVHIYCPTGGTLLSPVTLAEQPIWVEIDGRRNILHLETDLPGDFTLYKFKMNHSGIDSYFNDITFSFKANCPSDLDCKPPDHDCPPEDEVDFPVDYSARDFWSYRRALLDFASQRYPDWKDRLEADAGIMVTEVMSALGDDLAYYQDRIAREAYLETATQRKSVRRHARLVDYNIHDGLGATTWLDFTVAGNDNIKAGTGIWAESDKGVKVYYEVGHGLEENVNSLEYNVHEDRNDFQPHLWDEDDTCLFVGSTELYIKGHHEVDLPFNDPFDDPVGKWVLLKTTQTNPSIQERRWLVRLIAVENRNDPVFDEPVTRLKWEEEQALPFEMDLPALEVRGNIVPATAGIMMKRRFVIGVDPDVMSLPEEEKKKLVQAVERVGANGSVSYHFSLPDSDVSQLVWLGNEPRKSRPEIRLREVGFNGVNEEWDDANDDNYWNWKRSFLGSPSSLRNDCDFVIEDGMWRRVVGYQRNGQEIAHVDYASGEGFTIRFGDGEFGRIPTKGTIFEVIYRLGDGRRSNLPAGSLTMFDVSLGFIETVTNPLPSLNGVDSETLDEIRQLAPEEFRSISYRAVRPEDYAEAAERLPWVQQAGAVFRWTGSWLSVFVTPDPKGAVTVSETQRTELLNQMERFRQSGREVHVLDPVYVNLDLEISVCVKPESYRGEVKESVMFALLGRKGSGSKSGFFSPDNFTFGTPLERSRLEAAIQQVPGVRAVMGIRIRRRGWYKWKDFTGLVEDVDKNEIIRVENDQLNPERGSLKLIMKGGA